MTFLELAHAAASNPGVYSRPASDVSPWLVPIVISVSTLAAFFAIVAFSFAADVLVRKVKLAVIGVGLICVMISAGGFAGIQTAISDLDDRRAEARAEYTTAVSAWLESGYGIDADAKQSSRLANGESFVVEYDGKPTTISIVENLDGDLAVVDENRSPLTPRGE